MVQHANAPGAHSTHQDSSIWPNVLDPLKQIGEKIAGFFSPAADAAATKEAYEISVELPGVKSDDIVIELHDDLLTIKGEKHFKREESGRSYYFSERRYGAFRRSFTVPPGVDAAKVKAKFSKGVLSVSLPKSKKAQSHRKVSIKAD